jgi:SPX domain protein involved in polyphosphate accumulation
MARIEYKYLLPVSLIADFRKEIAPYVELDRYSARMQDRKYHVRSIYLDTALLDFYQDKIMGLSNRKKLRVRGYNHMNGNDLSFLEIKQKDGPGIVKYRAAVYFKNLVALWHSRDIDRYVVPLDGFTDYKEHAHHFIAQVIRLNLTPIIKIIYGREAYFYKLNHDVRITFDMDLCSSIQADLESLYQEENLVYSLPNQAILEVKVFGEIPGWLRRIIGRFNLQLEALSKYTICLENHSIYQTRLYKSLYGPSPYQQFKNFMITDKMD